MTVKEALEKECATLKSQIDLIVKEQEERGDSLFGYNRLHTYRLIRFSLLRIIKDIENDR